MTNKELWKTAYDAYWSWYDEERPKRWETDADECDAAAFQASAEAVAKRVEGPVYPKERAVIEAARVVQRSIATDWRDESWGRKLQDLCLKVKALDALEKK